MAFDSVRTVDSILEPATNNAAQSAGTTISQVTSFDSDGFTVIKRASGVNYVNASGNTYVGWSWKAGGAPTADNDNAAGAVPDLGSVMIDGVASTAALAGTIPAIRLSANTTSGFSIVEWEGTQANGTVAHGLGVAPDLIIAKDLESGAAWRVGSDSIPTAWEYVMYLNQTPGATDENTAFNDSPPTSSLFNLGASEDINTSGNKIVAYCFASIEGYSKVGSYTGNASADGAFIYTGFRPSFLIAKNYGASGKPCVMYDDKRSTYNEIDNQLVANDSAAQNTSEGRLDFVSNGIKWRIGDSYHNDGSFMYIAFAESPFKTSNAR